MDALDGSAAGRVALVTGANRGIGLAIARGLGERGARVLVTARDPAAAETAAQGLRQGGADAVPYRLDVTDQRSVDEAAASVAAGEGRLDILVNNAGAHFDTWQRASQADLGLVQAALDVNLLGAWRVALAFVPLMLRRRYGRIVNLSSGAATFRPNRGARTPAYSVAKAALNMLTLKLGADLEGTGILVNAACPGWTRTDMGGPDAARSPEEGADTPIWLALLPDGGPTGGLFRDRQATPW